MWSWRHKRVRRRGKPTKRYVAHKEAARALIHARLEALNAHYNFAYNRVAIRDQKSRWGSCSKKCNLNFNYRLIFLSPHLRDYVIVHELCHLQEFNHSPAFWRLLERAVPAYRACRKELRTMRLR